MLLLALVACDHGEIAPERKFVPPVPAPTSAPAPQPGPRPTIPLPALRPVATCDHGHVSVVHIEVCEAACKKGNAEACSTAAAKYWGGNGVKSSTRRSLEMALAGCRLGSANACSTAASVYSGFHDDDEGAFKDLAKHDDYTAKALPMFERDCAAGNWGACDTSSWWHAVPLGMRWKRLDATKSRYYTARGQRLTTAACDAHDGAACRSLALDHAVGDGVPEDLDKAFTLDVRACDAGDAEGCYSAATARRGKRGRDAAREQELMLAACALGLGKACELVPSYAKGVDVDAMAFYLRGCDLREEDACGSAAFAYQERKDLASAKTLYQRACELGSSYACGKLELPPFWTCHDEACIGSRGS